MFIGVTSLADAVMAQTGSAVVISEAPVYLFPDPRRTPLATLPVNTALRVLAEEGDWVRVEFQDARFGPRVGYVERSRVRITRIQQPVNPPSTEPQRQPPPAEQTKPTPKTAPGRASSLGARVYGTYSGTRFAASDTLEAVGSDSILGNFGGGGAVTGLWRGLFVDVGFSQVKFDGERVFVDDGTVFPLGIALQVKVQSLDFASGWRVTTGRLSSYVGGGATLTSFKETSAFSDPGDDLDEQKWGLMMLGGVDAELLKWVHIGAELRYRFVKGILGEDGVSEAFGEDDAGGFAVGVRVSLGK